MSNLKHLVTISFILLTFIGCNKPDTTTTYPIGYVHTQMGDMYFWLYDETPNHKAKFIELAKEKHYDDFSFNRVVKNFVIQGGCPDSTIFFENSPYLLEPEFVDSIGHVYGALGMGRDGNLGKLSNACQFYIVNKESGLPNLDNEYMIFGQLIKGFDVLTAISNVETDNTDTPLNTIPIEVRTKRFSADKLKKEFDFIVPLALKN